jgi:basic membrane protein A
VQQVSWAARESQVLELGERPPLFLVHFPGTAHTNGCERIANRQIDAGSGVVFAAAGDCGLGALSAAGIRGVWGVASGEDRSHLGPHVLASASNRMDRLVDLSVSWYLEGRLPPGGDVELGLVDDAVALVGINPDVPPLIRGKVAQEAARLRAQEVPQIPE